LARQNLAALASNEKQNRLPAVAGESTNAAGFGFWQVKCLVFSAGED
jgi:endo-beta-N-acetylglucosaminidase D